METVVVIMAGGKGERFWPKSRGNKPKQFLSLTQDGETLLQKAVARLEPLVGYENILVVTLEAYEALVRKQLPQIPKSNLLREPMGRNTAACVGLAAKYVEERWRDAVMVVVPADHLIGDEVAFRECIERGISYAVREQAIVTIGIVPTYPEVGYGYIHYNKSYPGKVESFEEKPSLNQARAYMESGEYLWNSGMFIWQVSVLNEAYQKYLPKLYEGLRTNEPYESLESISVDYGIMEKADNIGVVQGDFGWDDVGSWLAVARIHGIDEQGNALRGEIEVLETSDCIVDAQDKQIALFGVSDLVVVDTPDLLLICSKEKVPQMKQLTMTLGLKGKGVYL